MDDFEPFAQEEDVIHIYHVVQRHAAEQIIEGYDYNTAPAIAISKADYLRIPHISGTYNGKARNLLANDIRNLRIFAKAPNSALQELIKLNKSKYPSAFQKGKE